MPRDPPRSDRPPQRGGRGQPAGGRGLAPRDAFAGRPRRGGRGRSPAPPRSPDDLRPGTPLVILLDGREGEPDRSGSPATFEGFFDLETGELRRVGTGIPRLRVGEERLWGFECWWRVDSDKAGLSARDREDLEVSKRLLRGLLRDARRGSIRAR